MNCGLNFNCRAFSTTESGLLCPSLSLFLSLSHPLFPSLPLSVSPAQTLTIWLLKIFASSFFPYNSLPHTHPFISVIQQSSIKEAFHLENTGTPAFQQTVVCFDCVPERCFRPHCLPWDTHAGSCFPSFFFGHRVSLCFSGHGNHSSKHIL